MDYTSVSLRLHAPCSDRNKMNCILWPYSGFFSSSIFLYQCKFIDFLFLLHLRDKAGSECGIVFCLWTALQSFHLLRFLKETFSAYFRMKWLPARTCISRNFHASANDISDLVGLVLYIEQKQNLPPFSSVHNKPRPIMYTKLKKEAAFIFVSTQPQKFMMYHCIRALYKAKQISNIACVDCKYFMWGRSLIDDWVTARQECPSVTLHKQIWQGHGKQAADWSRSVRQSKLNHRHIPQIFTNATQILTNLDPLCKVTQCFY